MNNFKPFLFLLLFLATSLPAQDIIWPGDVNNNGVVNEVDLLVLGLGFGQTGPARKEVSTVWDKQPAPNNWQTSAVEGFNLAYADCNGDGTVDANDVEVIKANFGLSHDDVVFVPDVIPLGVSGVNPSFGVADNADLAIKPNTKQVKVPISLGDATIPIANLVGISFYIKANPKVFNVKETSFQLNGWLPEANSAIIQKVIAGGRSAPGDLVVAYTKTNNLPSSGNGLIGDITLTPGFILEDDVPDLKISIDSIVLIDNLNNKTPVLGTEIIFDAVGFRDSTTIDSTICQGQSIVFNDSTLTESGTYRDTLMNSVGGDSIIILNLTVLPTFQTNLIDSICQGVTIVFANDTLTTTGTYIDVLQAVNGCDSVVVLELTVKDTLQTVLNHTICQGDSFSFNDQDLMEAGTYRDTLMGVNGCDNYVVLNLMVEPAYEMFLNDTICQGAHIDFSGEMIMEAGTYRDTLQAANSCDSVLVLNLVVLDTSQMIIDQSICVGDSYDFNGEALTIAGTYRDTLVAANGCEQYVVLNLTLADTLQTVLDRSICAGDSFDFNGEALTTAGVYRDTLVAGNGCPQYVVLNLIVEDTLQTVIDQAICNGDSYQFKGQDLTVAGTYRDTLVAANGCAQYVILNLSVMDGLQTNISQMICPGGSYDFDNQSLTVSGTYTQTLQATSGCDSIVVLDLIVLENAIATFVQTICGGESVDFNGRILTESGTYRDTLTATNGCDSLMAISLTVLPTPETTINQTICMNSSYDFNGVILTAAGIYRDTLTSTNGCDSLLVLNLKVADRYETELNEIICEGSLIPFNGRNLTISGIYLDTFVAVNGCDSLVTLNLNVAATAYTIIRTEICTGGSMLFNNQTITDGGIYMDTLSTVMGCDSLIELDVKVLPILESSMEQTICAGDTLNFYNFVLTETNSYMVILETDEGCDSMVVLNLVVVEEMATSIDSMICPADKMLFGDQELSEAGTYTQSLTSAIGCDSIVTLNLTVGTAGVAPCMSVGIEEELLESIDIFPNPVTQSLFINAPTVKMTGIRLINTTGQTLIERSYEKGNTPTQTELNLQQVVPGVYWILVQTEFGLRQEKIVKF